MKKLIITAIIAMFFLACNNGKSKDGDVTTTKTENAKPAADDNAMKTWLQGKEWRAEKKGRP